jgi:hypothetical protein
MKIWCVAILLTASRVEASPTVLVDKQFQLDTVTLTPDGSTVLFTTGFDGGSVSSRLPRIDATLSSVPVAGGARKILYTGEVQGIVADETDIYFLNNERIWRMPRAGGKPTLLVNRADTLQTIGPALNDESMFSLAIDDTNVYWGERQSGRIRTIPKQGGAIATLATRQIGIGDVAVDGDFVYWTQTAQMRMGKEIKPKTAILRIAKRGGTPEPLVPADVAGDQAFRLRFDADAIYWLSDSGIRAAAKDGSGVRMIVADRQDFASDGDSIYVGGKTVRRIAKRGGAVTKLLDEPQPLAIAAAAGVVVVWNNDPNAIDMTPPAHWAPKNAIRRLQ